MLDAANRQLGEYQLLEPIGAGGMGQVYLAEHAHLRMKFAVKVLPAALVPFQAARFRALGRG